MVSAQGEVTLNWLLVQSKNEQFDLQIDKWRSVPGRGCK